MPADVEFVSVDDGCRSDRQGSAMPDSNRADFSGAAGVAVARLEHATDRR
jgi:hypothetical protein